MFQIGKWSSGKGQIGPYNTDHVEERLWSLPLSAARDPRLNTAGRVSIMTFPVTKKEVVNVRRAGRGTGSTKPLLTARCRASAFAL